MRAVTISMKNGESLLIETTSPRETFPISGQSLCRGLAAQKRETTEDLRELLFISPSFDAPIVAFVAAARSPACTRPCPCVTKSRKSSHPALGKAIRPAQPIILNQNSQRTSAFANLDRILFKGGHIHTSLLKSIETSEIDVSPIHDQKRARLAPCVDQERTGSSSKR
jgi:hypothetical protein